MDHLKQRLGLLHEDLSKLLKEAKVSGSSLSVPDLKAVLKLARDLEAFAIGRIAINEQASKKR